MKKHSSLIIILLLIFAVAVSGSIVLAQDSSDFGEVMQKISELEGLNNQQREQIIFSSIELHYQDKLDADQIAGVFDEYKDYSKIMSQFNEIENIGSSENTGLFGDEEDSNLDSNNTDFGGLMQRISELEDLDNEEKQEFMIRSAELHYNNGVDIYQISGVLDEYNDYDGIREQFDGLENIDSDESNENNDMIDDEEDYMLDSERSEFGELIQRISELEALTTPEKEEMLVRSIELHYEDGLEVYQISGVLDEYDDFDGIMGQFDEIENDENYFGLFDDENYDFGGIILDTLELEGLTDQEKEMIMVRAAELHYEVELTLDEISVVLDEYNDYNGIMAQFDELEAEQGLFDEAEDGLFGDDGLFDKDDDGLFD